MDRRVVDRRREDDLGRGGTLAPFARASEIPMATACLRDFTFAPLLLRNVPRLWRRMALATVLSAALPYFREVLRVVLRERVRRVVAMTNSR